MPVTIEEIVDAAPLAATEVKQDGGDRDVKIEAPIQAVDTAAQTVTVLGVAIDTSGASLDGADDTSSDGNSQPIDLSQLIVGQFVEAKLDSTTPPFTATELQVKNFSNQLEVDVRDGNGNPVEDVDDNGDPVDDVTVDVTETVSVQNPAGGTRRVKKVVQLHTGSNGSFTLSGLPTGRAKIVARRDNNGAIASGKRVVRVRGNSAHRIRLRLRRSSH